MSSFRFAFISIVAGLAIVASSSAATVPTIQRGKPLQIAVKINSTSVCTALVRYSDGGQQVGAPRRVRNGRISWSLLVAKTAATGPATWMVVCNGVPKAQGRFVVAVAKTITDADVPKVVVDKQGFSQRADKYDDGSDLTFGLFLHNTSTTQDALNVYVLVNMVGVDGQLIGSLSRTVPLIASTQTYAFGDTLHLRTQAGVSKLELTIRLGGHQVKEPHLWPEFANLTIGPSILYPGYVGEVDGEVLNTAPNKILSMTKLSVVLLDPSGNPIGGGTGNTYSPLPSGSRMVFLAQTGFNSAPLDKVLTAVVSAEPTYQAVLEEKCSKPRSSRGSPDKRRATPSPSSTCPTTAKRPGSGTAASSSKSSPKPRSSTVAPSASGTRSSSITQRTPERRAICPASTAMPSETSISARAVRASSIPSSTRIGGRA